MRWRNASDVTTYPSREQDKLLVQGYEKTRSNCLVLVSVDAQQLGHKHQSAHYHETERRSHLPILDYVVTRI